MVELITALSLFAVVALAALALPRWRTPYGPIVETALWVAALALRDRVSVLGLPIAASSVPVVAIGYVLVRMQRLAIDDAELATRGARVWRGAFHPGAIARSLHLLPLAAYVLCEMSFGSSPSLFRASAMPTPLAVPLVALTSRRAGVPVTVCVVALCVIGWAWRA